MRGDLGTLLAGAVESQHVSLTLVRKCRRDRLGQRDQVDLVLAVDHEFLGTWLGCGVGVESGAEWLGRPLAIQVLALTTERAVGDLANPCVGVSRRGDIRGLGEKALASGLNRVLDLVPRALAMLACQLGAEGLAGRPGDDEPKQRVDLG